MRYYRRLLLLAALLLAQCSQAEPLEQEAVRKLVNRYFTTWSAKEMEAYGACFAPQARITFVQGNGSVSIEGLTDFLHSQRMAHQMSPSPMTEVPKEMTIQMDKRIAQVRVRWELQKAGGNSTGTDFFTLALGPDSWQIVALVWQQD
jgi:Domain of unknown function (DUF4440)